MSADYGGTEMNRALQYVFDKRNSGVPTVAFVLTDGEVRCPFSCPLLRSNMKFEDHGRGRGD